MYLCFETFANDCILGLVYARVYTTFVYRQGKSVGHPCVTKLVSVGHQIPVGHRSIIAGGGGGGGNILLIVRIKVNMFW